MDKAQTELLLSQAVEVIQKLKNELEGYKEKANTFDRITSSDTWFDGKEVAKLLNYKGYGRNTIYSLLRELKIWDANNQPYQAYVDRGYFKLVLKENDYGLIFNVPLISANGINFIREAIDEHERVE